MVQAGVWRRAVAGISMLGVVLAGATTTAPALAAPAPDAEAKIEQAVQEELETQGRTDFWVRLEERPDLTQFAGVRDWAARGQGVYDALTSTATASQAGVRAKLDAEGATYETHWITNAVHVTAGSEDLALALAGRAEVEGIYPTRTYDVPEVRPVEPTAVGPAAVEWGIADINADDVWSEFGVTGEGIVVATIDTGVQYDHPALVEQYRGNNGDGTFDHDYHWFDAAGVSPEEPVDVDAHGTHVTGTMVGDDGGDNQVGVAPGARWIAANGCCPSDDALITSGEWMLAPTRVDGSDPDPAQRPHVINNSWGSGIPSNDPFMEDVSLAWAAAGQFGVWANGNIGPGCESSGSPGSLVVNYSVGNYDAAHQINDSSSRGAGQDGETKPNVSAPGTAVRSSVPGNDYAAFSGTSMASPHVAGSIALLWSSAPLLVGDLEATKDLLDGTAVDAPDDQCGGTDEDNNVFGEGRLDALALVEAAPRGDTGFVEGTVTDAASGDPLGRAQVSLDGPLERELTTDAEGRYRALVSAGDYALTASSFGWVSESAEVTVPVDGTVVQDFALDQAPTGTLSGTVSDGSGQGYPLYAKVSVGGTALTTFTDPLDGSYALDVPLDTPVVVRVEAQYPGYTVVSEEVSLEGDETLDVSMLVDVLTCVANGYAASSTGLTESFDTLELPDGWTVEDNLDNGQVWTFDDPGGMGNLTGGEGGFADVNSDFYGPDGSQDTSLVSPVVDLTGQTTPVVAFNHFYVELGDTADLDVSIDGGDTWTTVKTYTGEQIEVRDTVPLPMAAGQSQVQVRWHFYDANWTLWWQVDDVLLGSMSCDPVGAGGYVVGAVSSGVDGDPVSGATVANLDSGDSGMSKDTPADEGQDDGFYWLFSSLAGTHPFEATARSYSPARQDVGVPDEGAVRADFTLEGGVLTVDPGSIKTDVSLGEAQTRDLTVSNEGTGTAQVELREVGGDMTILRADGSRHSAADARAAEGAPVRTADVAASFGAAPGAGQASPSPRAPQEEPWTELTPYPTGIMDHRVVALDGQWYVVGGSDGSEPTDAVYRYDNAAMEWVEVAPLPMRVNAPAAGVVGGQIVVSGGWDDTGTTTGATFVYDAEADAWTQVADNPSVVSAAGQGVLDGRFYTVGGCTTGDCAPASPAVTAYDPGTDSWEEVADYPEGTAFTSCGGAEGQLFCSGGVDPGTGASSAATYAYDPVGDTWSPVADAPNDHWAAAYAAADGQLVVSGGVQQGDLSNETFGYDPAADTWVDLPNANVPSYRGAGACGFVKVGGSDGGTAVDVVELLPGFDECSDAGVDVPWLSLSQTELTLEPGESVTVQVTTDGDVAQPGAYTAGVRATGGVAGSDPTAEVTMTVQPPATWGKLTGLVQGEDCEGATDPLGGAVVDATPERADQPRWRMVTDADGLYARWIDTRVGDLELLASAAAHLSDSATVSPRRGEVVEQDFALLHEDCGTPPGPVNPEVERIAGEDRYGTAVLLSRTFAPGVEAVFVATGVDYPDALAAAARAGSIGAPVLLTTSDRLPAATAGELERLDPQEVVVLGGDGAIEDAVVEAIEESARVDARRLAGEDRYATAALVAAEFGTADTAYVATGRDYPDALAGAARAGRSDAPVLLVRPDAVPAATAAALTDLGVDEIVLLGGEGVVDDEVETMLEEWGEVTRVAGPDRYATAALLAGADETRAQVFIASGQNWPDALAGAATAGAVDAPMLLVRQDSVPPSTWTTLERLQPALVSVLGGDGAVADDVLEQLRTLE
ncbi:cell wall-binding repeat-containing protein [uncultured Serinicoccus sp.]|uniref:cell wall-binding repeat-containing protein n=1 Tax=uncultured Serinicoccus sp. TaxID=735514 RepID=UPI002621C366|nr:cell wall-binding repeat-containing protein [uncultured Serinicoccus sp.]